MAITRRQFMVGCSTAIAAMAGGYVGNLVFANPNQQGGLAASNEILVMVFLRGGCDGLNLVTPYNDPNYQNTRRALAVPATAALPIDPQNPSYSQSSNFGLHPQAAGLRELYNGGQLALIHACGLNDDTRSHFDAMDYIERGTPGNKNTSSGWLTRHLSIVGEEGALPTMAAGSSLPESLLANTRGVALSNPSDFDLSAPWRYNSTRENTNFATLSPMMTSMGKIYAGSSNIDAAGKRVLETIQTLKGKSFTDIPDPLPAPYPNHSFARALYAVAQILKADLGLRVATVDFGGWDTHENQGENGEGYFAQQIANLSGSLSAFYNEIAQAGINNRLNVVVISEFGRRLGVNESRGTDHGHGNVMMVMGGQVNGGKLYGDWPTLQNDRLDQRQDLAITTDFRTVLGEILAVRLSNNKLGGVFPGITPEIYSNEKRLGIVKGNNPASIDYSSTISVGGKSVYLPLVRR